MQIYSVTNSQNYRQNFGIKPDLLAEKEINAILAKKLSYDEIKKVAALFTNADNLTPHLTGFHFGIHRGNRLYSRAFTQELSYEAGNSVECRQRFWESTFNFLKRACNNAIELNKKAEKQIMINEALKKGLKGD